MLTNNFRKLISFYTDVNFKNVLKEDTSKRFFLGSKGGGSFGYNADPPYSADNSNLINNCKTANGHDPLGQTHCFNYNGTSGTNSFTKEKESYDWFGVTNTYTGSGNTPNYITVTYNGFVLFVGTNDDNENEDIGTNVVSENDYCLNKTIELPVTNASCLHNAYDKTYVSRTFENNTENDVEIKEIGCYMFRSPAGATTSNVPKKPIVMIGRKILSSPVTIPVGEQRTFTYIIDLSDISFEEAEAV